MLQPSSERIQVGQGSPHQGTSRQLPLGCHQDIDSAVQTHERREPAANLGIQPLDQLIECRRVLGRQGTNELGRVRRREINASEQATQDTGIAKIERDTRDAGAAQAVERQVLDLKVSLQACMTISLGTKLQRLSTGVQPLRARVQHRSAIAQARQPLPVQQMRVDARNLRRGISPHAQRPSAQLIDQLEGLEVQLAPGAG